MAWKIRQQFSNGKRIKKKVDRRWMANVLQQQQEIIQKLTRVIVKARIVVTPADFADGVTHTPLPEESRIVGPAANLGLPPFPDRRVLPITDPQTIAEVTIVK